MSWMLTLTLLPMVEQRATDLMKPWAPLPLTPLGRASMMAPKKAATFSNTAARLKFTLPRPAWMTAPLSCRKSTRPFLNSAIVATTSSVTVPFFGLGMSPFGPRMRAMEARPDIMPGVAMAWSKSMLAPLLSRMASTSSLPPTTSAPASRAFSTSKASRANTASRVCFPVPWGSTADPRTMWSLRFGSVASFTCSSTVSTNLARASPNTMSTARSSSTSSFFRFHPASAACASASAAAASTTGWAAKPTQNATRLA
mmetsp:Transcript_6746/g.16474  ORF Transcript_6746/g.16474 Transcript_6746/m.16474 type:complete len:256 (+) Transcript_6746:2733-3500(+)